MISSTLFRQTRIAFFIIILTSSQILFSQDGVKPGEFIVEPPTLTNLGAIEEGMPEPVYGTRGEIFNRPFYR